MLVGRFERGQLVPVCKCVHILNILDVPIACIEFEINFVYSWVTLPNTVTVALMMPLLQECYVVL
jgi:hypothetical protein